MAKVFVSSVVHAPLVLVWNCVRDFNGMPSWHPAIADSRIEQGLRSDTVGCVRNFNLTSGGKLRERLVALSDEDHSFTYRIVDGPMPVENYIATLQLRSVRDDDSTYGDWTAEFHVSDDKEKEIVDLVTGVFQAGFDALRQK